MRTFIIILFCLGYLTLLGQNLIDRQEYWVQGDHGNWRKSSITEYKYTLQGILIGEKKLRYFGNDIDSWVPLNETHYNTDGDIIQTVRRYLISSDVGFSQSTANYTYNNQGQLISIEAFAKYGKNSPVYQITKEEFKYVDECSYFNTLYKLDEESNQLVLKNQTFNLYDKNCSFVTRVSKSDDLEPLETLQSKVKVRFVPAADGGEIRYAERLQCSESLDCDDWEVVNVRIYDKIGRLIFYSFGSPDSFNWINYTDYYPNEIVRTYESYGPVNGSSNTLISREVKIFDLEEHILSEEKFGPFSYEQSIYNYNDLKYLQEIVHRTTQKEGVNEYMSFDTTRYQYQFLCDGLLSEEGTTSGPIRLFKKINHYLYPSNCGERQLVENFTIYPNPTSDGFIRLENAAFTTGVFRISVFDILGRKIRQLTNLSNKLQNYDLSDLPNGLYQLSILQDKDRITRPFVIFK